MAVKRTIKEKNEIVRKYLSGEVGWQNSLRQNGISSDSVFSNWIRQYREHGTTTDTRGRKATGRPKKKIIDLNSMTKEELINYIGALEDIKKTTAYLKQ